MTEAGKPLSPATDKTSKHRLQARLMTRVPARLVVPPDTVLLCEIRDFSQEGLQVVALDRAAAEAAIRPDMVGTAVEVEFLLEEGTAKSQRLRATLAHAGVAEYGLRTEKMGRVAYQALVDARSRIAVSDSPMDGLFPEEHHAILRDCLHLFHGFLDRVWREFMIQIDDRLTRRDTDSLPLSQQMRYLGALQDLRHRGAEIGRAHYGCLIDQMRRMAEPREEPQRPLETESELSIVDDDSFQEWLNISQVFNRIEADNRSAMYEFAQRFARLTPVAIDRHNDPFGPESVCLAFQESLREIDFTLDMRATIYRLFGEALGRHYPSLYEQLNGLLQPLKPARAERPQAAPPSPSFAVNPADRGLPDGERQPVSDISAQVNKLAEIAERLFAFSPTGQAAAMPTDPASAQFTPSAPPAFSPAPVGPAPAIGQPVAVLPQVELNLLQSLKQTLALLQTSPGAVVLSPTAREPVPAGVAQHALEELLTRAPAGPTLSSRISALVNQPEAGALGEWQRGSLNVAANLMDQALAEHVPESELDSLLKKLERLLYEQVLRGEDPLGQDGHPMQRLLNLVDRFAIVADDDGRFLDRELYDLLVSVIDHAVEKDGQEAGALTKAGDALERLLKYPRQYHRQRILEHQELCEAQAGILKARRTVADWLDQRLAGRTVPKAVIGLLEAGLRQDLILQTLRDDREACAETLGLLDRLASELTATPDTLRELGDRLARVNPDAIQVEHSLAALRKQFAQPDQTVDLPAGWFRREAEKNTPQPTPGVTIPAPRIGEWFDFEQDGRRVPMQLIWTSMPSATLGFVNRSGTRKVILSLAEFAQRQADKSIALGENRDLPLLERSEVGAVDSLYRRLAHRAHHDPATGLLNRKGFMIEAARRPSLSGKGHVVGVIEYLPYRAILDTCGIEASERLAQELAALLQRRIGPSDLLALVGDGRFAVLLPDIDTHGARQASTNLARASQDYLFRHGDRKYPIEAHIGLASLMPGVTDPAEAMHRASTACSAAIRGNEPIQAYEDAGNQLREQQALQDWGRRLDTLLGGDGGLFLRCQKVAPLTGDSAAYYEVLLGVRDETGQVVSPQPFVEAVEYWKRSRDLDLWVIDATFAWIRANLAAFHATGGLSINLSALSLSDQDILDHLHGHLSAGGLDTRKVIFEITETATVGSFDQAREFIRQIRDSYGCRFCIDDFGSGNASYGYLRHLKTDTLKIDGSFVRDVVGDPDLLAMVKSMNDIGHSLGMKTVAEFVASPEILALMREIGVDYGQGYEIEKPIHIDELKILAGLQLA